MLKWEQVEASNVTECMTILNACHVPEAIRSKLYERITPVNTFRLVFNHYLGTDQELLADLRKKPGPTGSELARLRRKADAAKMATEPHYNGVLDPGKMAGRAKRRG